MICRHEEQESSACERVRVRLTRRGRTHDNECECASACSAQRRFIEVRIYRGRMNRERAIWYALDYMRCADNVCAITKGALIKRVSEKGRISDIALLSLLQFVKYCKNANCNTVLQNYKWVLVSERF